MLSATKSMNYEVQNKEKFHTQDYNGSHPKSKIFSHLHNRFSNVYAIGVFVPVQQDTINISTQTLFI